MLSKLARGMAPVPSPTAGVEPSSPLANMETLQVCSSSSVEMT